MLTFEQMNELLDEVTEFLKECGEAYKDCNNTVLQQHLIKALVTGQFVYRPGEYFCCWDKEDGAVYISDAGCKIGKLGCLQMMREVKERAAPFRKAYWYRYNKGWRQYNYPEGNL